MGDRPRFDRFTVLGEPSKMMLRRVAGKILVDLGDLSSSACDCICHCDCEPNICHCDCSNLCNCDCDCLSPDVDLGAGGILDDLRGQTSRIDQRLDDLDTRFGEITDILKSMQKRKT